MNVFASDQLETTQPRPACADRAERRQWVRDNPKWFGIDFVEVEPHQDGPWKLRVGLLDANLPQQLVAANFRIDGSPESRRSPIRVASLAPCDPHDPTVPAAVLLTLQPRDPLRPSDCPGDFGTYVLRLVEVQSNKPSEPSLHRKREADPVFDRASFRFSPQPDCDDGVEADCGPRALAAPDQPIPPGGPAAIDYLARDYEGLRDLMLRRLQLTMPDWTERHASDLMVTLVELLAYAGDRLSYAQDAVATEAYLSTARRRISVRRLASLISYRVSEGCAARSWICLDLEPGGDPVQIGVRDLTFRTTPALDRPLGAQNDGSIAFIPVVPTWGSNADDAVAYSFHSSHNTLHFYSWGDSACQLPVGTTSATLWPGPGQFPVRRRPLTRITIEEPVTDLGQAVPAPRPGDVLLFVEMVGRRTGNPADADPAHRHAVRLEHVESVYDPLTLQTVWRVSWNAADALPFSLTISCLVPKVPGNRNGTTSTHDRPWECQVIPDCTVVKGNVLLVEHGEWVTSRSTLRVPDNIIPAPECPAPGPPQYPPEIASPFRPLIADGPITHAEPFPRLDDVATRQAYVLRRFRDRLSQLLNLVVEELSAEDHPPLTQDEKLGRLMLALFDQRNLNEINFNLDPIREPDVTKRKAAEAERHLKQREAIRHFRELPRSRLVEVLRWMDSLIQRLIRGRPLTKVDQAQFERELGLTVDELEMEGLTWKSARWLGPATIATSPNPSLAVPKIILTDDEQQVWIPQYDLLSSGPDDRHFVAEIDDSGQAQLRFPIPVSTTNSLSETDALGMAPTPGQKFITEYRKGNGSLGNLPAGALTRFHVGKNRSISIESIFQPLPATGGTEPEPLDHVRRLAPGAIQGRLSRAITAEDYATLTRLLPGVANANATSVFDGLGTRILIAVDAAGSAEASTELLDRIRGAIEAYRRIDHDIAVIPATYVALKLTLSFRVADGAQAGHVREALLDLFSANQGGYFDPDRWSFGRSVEVGEILTHARSVFGVQDIAVIELVRLDPDGGRFRDHRVRHQGLLQIGPTEIARLENDPNRPERGILQFILQEGCDVTCSASAPRSSHP